MRASRTVASLDPLPIWCAWRHEADEKGRPVKPPISVRTHKKADTSDTTHLGTRRQAQAAANAVDGGIGLVMGLLPDDASLAIGMADLDGARDPETGALAAWAEAIIRRFDSNSEISPSHAGVKVFFLFRVADLPKIQKLIGRNKLSIAFKRGHHEGIEIYLGKRYGTITGQAIDDYSTLIAEPTLFEVDLPTLRWLIAEAGPEYLRRSPQGCEKDQSGSAYGWRFLKERMRFGDDDEAALAALQANGGAAGEWASRAPEREILKTVAKARAEVAARAVDPDAAFDDTDVAKPDWLAMMNERHAVARIGGDTLVINTDGKVITYSSFADLKNLYLNRIVRHDGKIASIASHWIMHPQRRTYENGVVFAPEKAFVGAYNLFQGWGVEPKAGSCRLYLDHLLHVICKNDETNFNWLVDYLAHIVQKPCEKPGVAIVLRGKKGVGKDTLGEYLRPLLGKHCVKIGHIDQLTGRFNSALQNTLLVHVEELYWAGNRGAEGSLKHLITSEKLRIEPKGIDSFELDSFIRLLLTSNEDWVVPASDGERRYFVLDVSNRWGVIEADKKARAAYFSALYGERDKGGAAALLDMLQRRDISKFNPRQAPETEGLLNQKIASLRGEQRWWLDVLMSGELPRDEMDDVPDWSGPVWVKLSRLHDDYADRMKRERHEARALALNVFGAKLAEMCPGLTSGTRWIDRKSVRMHDLPPLFRCREALEKLFGGPIDWPDGNFDHLI